MTYSEFRKVLRSHGVSITTHDQMMRNGEPVMELVTFTGKKPVNAFIQDFGANGFEVYLPATDSNKVKDLLAAVLARV